MWLDLHRLLKYGNVSSNGAGVIRVPFLERLRDQDRGRLQAMDEDLSIYTIVNVLFLNLLRLVRRTWWLPSKRVGHNVLGTRDVFDFEVE